MFLGREIMASGIAGKLDVDKGEMRRETLEILRDLPQVMELADWIYVLRQGANAEHFKPSDVSWQDIVDLMPKWRKI